MHATRLRLVPRPTPRRGVLARRRERWLGRTVACATSSPPPSVLDGGPGPKAHE
jgi:hypothetical protein